MRLQVFLSHAGVCSRRKALGFIQSQRVSVNHKTIMEPSCAIDEERDVIALDGKQIFLPGKTYVLLNKPKGVVTTTHDRFASKTVMDLLPQDLGHLHPVGRLDKDTTGLLLLTNDGLLTHRLIHPSFETQKTYRAFLDKVVLPKDVLTLQKGILLEGRKTAPCKIKKLADTWVEVILHEGRKRQIRRMFGLLHYHVKELVRIREGSLVLGDLKAGVWRFLKKEEVGALYKELKLDKVVR